MTVWNDTDIPLAFLITFRTYGSWLHGDMRGSIDRYNNVIEVRESLRTRFGKAASRKAYAGTRNPRRQTTRIGQRGDNRSVRQAKLGFALGKCSYKSCSYGCIHR